MARKRNPRATAKRVPDGIVPLSREELAKYTRIAHENFVAAQENALKLVKSRKEDAASGHPTNAESAMAFLWFSCRLTVTIDLADKDEAVKAALFFGAATASFFPNRNGKTMLEVERSYEGHGKGGEETKLIQSDNDWRTFREVLDKCHTGKRPNYKAVATELFRRRIKGRDGVKMSISTIARLRKELEQREQR
jgi:hypothetical protein